MGQRLQSSRSTSTMSWGHMPEKPSKSKSSNLVPTDFRTKIVLRSGSIPPIQVIQPIPNRPTNSLIFCSEGLSSNSSNPGHFVRSILNETKPWLILPTILSIRHTEASGSLYLREKWRRGNSLVKARLKVKAKWSDLYRARTCTRIGKKRPARHSFFSEFQSCGPGQWFKQRGVHFIDLTSPLYERLKEGLNFSNINFHFPARSYFDYL